MTSVPPTGALLTIPELFDSAVDEAPSKVWLFYEDSSWTFARAHERIGGTAAALRGLGLGRDTRVLATTRNSPAYLFAWLAAAYLGAVFVPANPESSPVEIAGLVRQVEPGVVLTDADLRPLVEQGVEDAGSSAPIALADELLDGPGTRPPEHRVRPGDVAVMMPTSGTTGRSKLVMQTHRAYAMAGEGFPFWMDLGQDDRLMTSLPLFHINAPAYSVLGSVAARASVVLLPRFSARRFVDLARRYGATEFNAIGAMLEILMRQPAGDDDADNPLRLCYTGPAPTKQRQLEIEARFGLRIVCGYAMSETPYGLIWERGTRPYGTLGSPRQHPTMGTVNEARVRDGDRPVGVGEVGELELKNPAVMLGYYRMPEETDKVLAGGWLKTGDLVTPNPDGTYTFVGRKKELIRRRGENLSPLEVEAALEEHPAVVEAAVVGVPSELSEEEVKGFLVLREGADAALGEIRDFAAARLAPYKVPRFLEAVAELPHTPTGRIAKHELPAERTRAEIDFGSGAGPAVRKGGGG
jgi:crotonobetaine/carnitine-CoA ligase